MAATKRLLKERANLARDPIPYVTFYGEDDDDGDGAGGGSAGSIYEWLIVLALDPTHDSLDEASVIGSAKESPYCGTPSGMATAPGNASSSSSGKSKAGSILAGVTRAAKASASKASSSSGGSNGSVSASPSHFGGPAYFAFKLSFPPNYPFKPPKITVLSHSYHPNIMAKTGEICDYILTGEGWGPTLNIRKVCARLRNFLCNPDPEHPLEENIAKMFVDSPAEYAGKALKYAGEYATRGKAVEAVTKK